MCKRTIQRLYAERKGPDALAEFRARRALHKRRQRARRRAEGLTAHGKPLKNPRSQASALRAAGQHPADCPCYDCLYGRPNNGSTWEPREYRVLRGR